MKPSEIIKNLRTATNIKQRQLGDLLKLSTSSYTQKENGNTSFTADELFIVLNFLKPHVTEEQYLSAITDLLDSPGSDVQSKTSIPPLNPTPIDEATQILNEVLEEEGKTLTPEIARNLTKIIRHALKDDAFETGQYSIKIQNELDWRHFKVISQFESKNIACRANEKLVSIEKTDIDSFSEIINEINRVHKCLEKGIDPYPITNEGGKKAFGE